MAAEKSVLACTHWNLSKPEEYFTKFITGELDIDENWQAFLDAFNQAGNDVVTEDVNAFMSEK